MAHPSVHQQGISPAHSKLFFEISRDLLTVSHIGSGCWLHVNPAMTDTLGWSYAELVSSPHWDKIHPEDRERAQAIVNSFLDGEKLTAAVDYRIACKDGQYRWIAWKKAISVEDGLLICAGRDVTEQRRYEDRIVESLHGKTVELQQARVQLEHLASNLLSAQEDERRRISRDLHDSVIQQLAVISIEISNLREGMQDGLDHVPGKLGTIHSRVHGLLTDVREISHKLHPSILEHLGLAAALRSLADDFEARHGMHLVSELCEVSRDVPLAIATNLYRIAQEALVNVAKHAGIHDRQILVKVTLIQDGKFLRLSIADNGIGVLLDSPFNSTGIGLSSMRERARSLGGAVSISRAPSGGTVVTAEIPFENAEQDAICPDRR